MTESHFGTKTFALASILLTAAACSSAFAQVNQSSLPRINQAVDETKLFTLSGNTLRLAQAKFDLGPVPDDTSGRMLLVLKRSAEQETALQQLLVDQKTPGSENYHKWLTPAEFGTRFGVADSDVQTVTGYLASQGFQVGRVYQGKGVIEVTGSAAQIRQSFHTQMHRYEVSGTQFVANQSDPQIPAALAPVVSGFAALNSHTGTQTKVATKGSVDAATGRVQPLYDGPIVGGYPSYYAISPGDLKVLYHIPAPSGATPVTIGVISDSNVNLQFLANYTALFATNATVPTVVVDGNDPGTGNDSLTTLEELEIISGVDPSASVTLYTAATTDYDTGLDFAIIRAVDDDAVNVLEIGASECEANLGIGGNQFLSNAWEQASAQGISVVAATGDAGSAGCDVPGAISGTEVATSGLAVNGYASTLFDTAVGGTDFYYPSNSKSVISTQWSTTNTGTPAFTSALSYVAEQPWNDSIQTYDQVKTTPTSLEGGGGGPSTAGSVAVDGVTVIPWAQPGWQTTAATVSAAARVIPDVSFFAGDGANYSSYLLCAAPTDCASGTSSTFTMAGGTAAAAAVFSGIAGLLVQKDGPQGNLNPELYALYAAHVTPAAFHDVTVGSNEMACSGANGCVLGVMTGYPALANYDGATGLGSLDAGNFVTNWASVKNRASTPTLTMAVTANGAPLPASIVHGTQVLIAVTATGAAGTPTGDVSIVSTNSFAANKGIEALTLAPTGTVGKSYVDDTPLDDDFLPGGTYTLVANYAGGLTYGPAKSNRVSMNVTPEPSQVLLISSTLAFNAGTFSGAALQYGQPVTITVEPFSLNVNAIGIPSGSVQVYDQQTNATLASIALNSEGTATFVLNQLALGSHSLVFKYLGDASFQASTSVQNTNNGSINSPLPGNPVQTAVSFVVGTDVAMTTLTSSANSVSFENTSATLTAIVQASTLPNTGRAPTGSVRFSDNNTLVTLVPTYDSNGNAISVATETVTPNLILGGTATYSATYVPDGASIYSAGVASNTVSISEVILSFPNSNTVTTIAAANNNTSFPNTSPLVFNITVKPQPFYTVLGGVLSGGTVTVMANGVAIGSPVTLSAGTATFTVPLVDNYLQLPSGPVTISAEYDADGKITGCFVFCPTAAQASIGSDQITITGSTGGAGSTNPTLSGDFAIMPLNTAAPVSPVITTATFNLQLTSLNNFAANYGNTELINLSCTAPAGVVCSFNPSSTVPTTSISLVAGWANPNLYVSNASGSNFASVPRTHDRPWWPTAGGVTLACVLLGGIPGKRRKTQAFFMVLMLALASAGLGGCGSSGLSSAAQEASKASSFGSGGSGQQLQVSLGTYPVTVTASTFTTTTIVHSTTVNLVVQ